MPKVAGLFIQHLKSAQSKRRWEVIIGRRGVEFDRFWAVVAHGTFVAQRGLWTPNNREGVGFQNLAMRTISTTFNPSEGSLCLQAPGTRPLNLPVEGRNGSEMEVRMWRSTAVGIDQGDEASRWISQVLPPKWDANYRLVRISDAHIRRSDDGMAEVAFHDGFPELITTGKPTMQQLNSRLPAGTPAMEIDRFRPTIDLEGEEGEELLPHAEDEYKLIQIGTVVLRGSWLCTRCSIPCTDQETGRISAEPNKTLGTYHKDGLDRVVLGRNASHLSTGVIHVGDRVEVLETGPAELAP